MKRFMEFTPGTVIVANTKYLLITWRRSTRRPDGHVPLVVAPTVYLQVLRLEIVVWYR